MDTTNVTMENDWSSSTNLLAKSEPRPDGIPLLEHAVNVAEKVHEYLDSPAVSRVIQRTPLELGDVKQLGWVAGFYHDFGKANPEWQEKCYTALNNPESRINFPTHSALSAAYLFESIRGLPLNETLQQNTGILIAPVIAVLYHHTPFRKKRMDLETNTYHVSQSQKTTNMVQNLRQDARSTPIPEKWVPDVEITGDTRKKLAQLSGQAEIDTSYYDTLGVLTTVIRSALKQADHYVSADEVGDSIGEPMKLSPDEIQLFPSLRPFQSKFQRQIEPQMVSIAGCGEGKTHTALQWGKELLSDGDVDRIVFAMPTQVTSNNLAYSLGDSESDGGYVDTEVGIYHSASDSLYNTQEEDNPRTATLSTQQSSEWFQSPVTVTTIDHVLRTLLNGYEGAGVARGNLLRAGIIFDEIHAYDSILTGNLLDALRELNHYNVPWYVMTATLPPQIEHNEAVDPATQIESDGVVRRNDETSERCPFRFSVQTSELSPDDVIDYTSNTNANRVMVVRNTVRSAKETAEQLREYGDVIYYSSEFTRDDRLRKENEIRTQFGDHGHSNEDDVKFLVTTQVCEISLDLSADLLLTDVAPIDAIIQRAGRLHRSGITPESDACPCNQCKTKNSEHRYQCVVFSPLNQLPDDESWYPYAESQESEEWTLLKRTSDQLSEIDKYRFSESIDWVNWVYSGVNIGVDSTVYGEKVQEDWWYGKDRELTPDSDSTANEVTIRSITQYRQNVFAAQYRRNGKEQPPEELWQTFHDCPYMGDCRVNGDTWSKCHSDFREFQQKHSVPVPGWWLHQSQNPVPELGSVTESDILEDSIYGIEYSYRDGPTPIEQ